MFARRLVPASLVVALAVLGACSDDGLSAREQEFADAWAQALRDDEDGLSATAEEAECMGEAIMAELGTDPFDNEDVAPDDIAEDEDSNSPGELVGDGVISDDQAGAILDVWEEECADLGEVLARSAGGDFELDEDGLECFTEGLDEGTLARDLLRPSFTSGDDTPDAGTLTSMLELLDSCGDTSAASSMVSSIAAGLVEDGAVTQLQAQCLAQYLVDELGLGRIVDVTSGGDFEDADPADQEAFASALIAAAGDCDVPLTALGG